LYFIQTKQDSPLNPEVYSIEAETQDANNRMKFGTNVAGESITNINIEIGRTEQKRTRRTLGVIYSSQTVITGVV